MPLPYSAGASTAAKGNTEKENKQSEKPSSFIDPAEEAGSIQPVEAVGASEIEEQQETLAQETQLAKSPAEPDLTEQIKDMLAVQMQ